MPKMPKVPKRPKVKEVYLFKFLRSTERSEAIILGTLGILEHFRHYYIHARCYYFYICLK